MLSAERDVDGVAAAVEEENGELGTEPSTPCCGTSPRGKLEPHSAFHSQKFSKSRCHALKLNITCSMFNLVRVRVVTKSTPPSSLNAFSPSSTYLLGPTSTTSSLLKWEGCLRARHLAISPLPISLTLTLSPPRPRLSPPLRSRSVPRPKSEFRSPSLAPRVSFDLPPSPSCVASPLVLFARRVLCFSRPPLVTLESLYHPLASSFRSSPGPRLRSCAGKLGMYSTSYF